METLHLSIIVIFLISIVSGGIAYAEIPSNTKNVEIQNIQVQPTIIKVGDTFKVNATLVNNSPNQILLQYGVCNGQFSVIFNNHVTVDQNQIMCPMIATLQQIEPGEKSTMTSPGSAFTYRATAAGAANATVTISYIVGNQTDPNQSETGTISKSFLFTISDNSSGTKIVTENVLSPFKQLKSGIQAQDIKCKEGLVLVIKESNEDPACVKPTTVTRFLSHGWISVEKFQSLHHIVQLNKTDTINSKLINQIVSTNQSVSSFSNINTGIASNQTIINATSPVIRDILRNLLHGTSLGNGLVWVNPDIIKFTNKTLYVPTFVPLPEVTSNPTILYSTMPNYIKILSVGMSPNPLKVGDTPEFTVTYQNISKKPITHPTSFFRDIWFDYSISPQDMIKEDIFKENSTILNGGINKDLQPNQIVTDAGLGSASPIDPLVNIEGSPIHVHYKVTKAGMLTVTMKMLLDVGLSELSETIQFNVNATQ